MDSFWQCLAQKYLMEGTEKSHKIASDNIRSWSKGRSQKALNSAKTNSTLIFLMLYFFFYCITIFFLLFLSYLVFFSFIFSSYFFFPFFFLIFSSFYSFFLLFYWFPSCSLSLFFLSPFFLFILFFFLFYLLVILSFFFCNSFSLFCFLILFSFAIVSVVDVGFFCMFLFGFVLSTPIQQLAWCGQDSASQPASHKWDNNNQDTVTTRESR